MAFSNTTNPSIAQEHSRHARLDQMTLESLYRQGYQVDEIILRDLYAVKCSLVSSCPGMLYVTTERVYFVSNSHTHDIGFFLDAIVSLMLDDGSYPMLTFVLEHETFSFGSLIDRQDIIDLLKGAFPRMEVSQTKVAPQGQLNQFQTANRVSKTAIQDDKSKQEREANLILEILKNNTCKFFLANCYCPFMLFCEKEHLTQAQLNARISEHTIAKNATSNEAADVEIAEFFTSDESVVKSKQLSSYHPLLRHVRHHSFSDSNSAFQSLNQSPLAGILDFDRGGGSGGLRKSNSMEFMDRSHNGDASSHGLEFLGSPIIRSNSSDQIGASTSPDLPFLKTNTRNISPTIISFLNDALESNTPENIHTPSIHRSSPELIEIPIDTPENLSISPNKLNLSTPPNFFTHFSYDSSTSQDSIPSPQPGDPCRFFLSGFCRNGDNCPYNHALFEGVPFQGDLSTFPQTLTCFSDKSIGKEIAYSSDKIILSPLILVICERNNFQYPMSFSLTNLKTNKKLFVGVLEFTSTEVNNTYIPQWMLSHLSIAEGEEVGFKHEDLPKGVFCRLQPVSSSWLSIPYEKRTEILEFWLKKYQNLTEGMRIDIHYEMNKYSLKVLKCKPSEGISIVNADIQTDIIEPHDCDELYSPEEGQAQRLYLGSPVHCSLAPGVYRHFVLLYFPNSNHPQSVRISLNVQKGDPDLYISQTHTAPSQVLYQWCCQDVGSKELSFGLGDALFNPNESVHVGVMSFSEHSQFSICFHRDDSLQINGATRDLGKTLRLTNQTPSTIPDTTQDATPPHGHVQCIHCSLYMPPLRLAMHERHCKLSTYRCPDCNECIPIAAKEKHPFIMHTKLACCCGEVYTQYDLNAHQLSSCVKRTVKCSHKWCNLAFPMDEIHIHETTCGTRVTSCPICNIDSTFMELEPHLFAFHSIDVTRINWALPLNAQSLRKSGPGNTDGLKCNCGQSFTQLDDLQVHQLTSCALASLSNGNNATEEEAKVNGDVTCEKPQEAVQESSSKED